MRNAQKTAVMALFAAMEAAKEADHRRHDHRLPGNPPADKAIQIDPLWLVSFGAKGRA